MTARIAFALALILASSGSARAASIVPLQAERSYTSTHYEDDVLISTFGVSDFGFDPIIPPIPFPDLAFNTLGSEIGERAVTAELWANGEEYDGGGVRNEDVGRALFFLEFEVTADADYTLDLFMDSRQIRQIAAQPDELLGNSSFQLSFFDESRQIFENLWDFSGAGCLLNAPCPVSRFGVSDGNGGFNLTLEAEGSLEAGRYRLLAVTESWGFPFGHPDSPFWDEGLANRSSLDFTLALPEPGSGLLILLAIATSCTARGRRLRGLREERL